MVGWNLHFFVHACLPVGRQVWLRRARKLGWVCRNRGGFIRTSFIINTRMLSSGS